MAEEVLDRRHVAFARRVADLVEQTMVFGPDGLDQCIPGSFCPPRNTVALGAKLYYEGESNNDPNTGYPKRYTCGPAATRNMVSAMGAADPGEWALQQWEQTNKPTSEGGNGAGTYMGSIVKTLNDHYAGWGPGAWEAYKPLTANKLFARVVTDVGKYRAPLVENVDTQYLPFWNGHSTSHYDTLQGYNYNSSELYIGEEWDTSVNNVGTSQYGNPYGYHWTNMNNPYNAVHGSPSGDVTFG